MISNISQQIRPDLDVQNILKAHKNCDGFAVLNGEKNLIFLEPVLKISNYQDFARMHSSKREIGRDANPLTILHEIANMMRRVIEPIPLMCGFFSYEFLHHIEQLAKPKSDAYRVPSYLFYLYKKILVVDEQIQLFSIEYEEFVQPFWTMQAVDFERNAQNLNITNKIPQISCDLAQLEQYSNFSRADYIQAVENIRERILDGLVYQVNLSQQFILPFHEEPFDFYLRLKEISPARKAAYINVSDNTHNFSIISSSPELFIKGDSTQLLSSPIKGTRLRSAKPKEDLRLKNELLTSDKDLAELAMIVDLIRNDMGKVAEIGSVQVRDFPRLESYAQVHHLVADVLCKLKPSANFVDILCAMFPCGSISGCPKIAAMETITALEKTQRGVYTGSIGYLGGAGIFDFNVAIRTALVRNDLLIFQAGGGVVIDSNPESEYLETLAKAKGIFQTWSHSR